jgi:hypothetical protein
MASGTSKTENLFSVTTIAVRNSLIPGGSETEIRDGVGEAAEANELLMGILERAIHSHLSPPHR